MILRSSSSRTPSSADALASDATLPDDVYPLFHGSRAEGDAKFRGLVGSFAKTMDEAKLKKIGERTPAVAQPIVKVEPLV